MRVLLDTHVIIWAALDNQRLSPLAREAIESLKNDVLVSAASAWEIATKVRVGKLPGAEMLAVEFSARVNRMGFEQLPITGDHAQRAGLLAGEHKDPFDRMLVAQSIIEDLTIISNESIFEQWPVRRLW